MADIFSDALKIEYWPLANIKRYPGNPRKRSKKAVEKVAASIREFGWRQPIVVDEDGIILAGHTRLDAAELLALATAPVHQAFGLSEAQKKAFRIADNRTNELTVRQVSSYVRGGPVDGEDDVPPVPKVPVTKRGDLWVLGEHRLLCGDSTSAEDVARLMKGDRAALCFTSPPYNAGAYTLTGNVKKLDKSSRYEGRSDDLPEQEYTDLLVRFSRIALEYCDVVAVNLQQLANNKRSVLVWAANLVDHFVDRAVWYKGHGNPAMARNVMASRFEDIWIFSHLKNPTRAIETADFTGTVENVVESAGASSENDIPGSHCATMPVAVGRYAIHSWTTPASLMLDPFAGAGTTIIAAEAEKRRCYGLEIEPAYCDVIVQRWQKFSGKRAHTEDGVLFPEEVAA